MEKGSFHRSSDYIHSLNQSFTDSRPEGFLERKKVEAEEVSLIPLPSEVPPKINLNQVPNHILRSAAVETLFQQNEDLTARLQVQLRRNTDLEEELQMFREGSSEIHREADRLRDELLIYKEKDRMLSSRHRSTEDEIDGLKDKILFLETQYAELYSTSKEKQSQLKAMTHALSRHKKYRRALRSAALRLRDSLREALVEKEKEKKINKDLMQNLGDAGERIQYLSRQNQTERKELVTAYEAQLQNLREQMSSAREELVQMESLRKHNEQLKDERIEWGNQKVRLERILESERESQARQTRELQEALAGYRQDSKEKALQLRSLENDLQDLRRAKEALQEERQGFVEQVESLQCLWRDNQNQIEKMSSQIESLQKLNQQLSQQINLTRKENTDLRNKSESQRFQDEERIRELASQVQLLQSSGLKEKI